MYNFSSKSLELEGLCSTRARITLGNTQSAEIGRQHAEKFWGFTGEDASILTKIQERLQTLTK